MCECGGCEIFSSVGRKGDGPLFVVARRGIYTPFFALLFLFLGFPLFLAYIWTDDVW